MKKRAAPVAWQVWLRNDRHRRVIEILDGRVFYSTGGDTNRHCLLKTWMRWSRGAHLMPQCWI